MSFMLLGILNAQASGGAAGAFDLLETTTLTSSASSVSFSGLDAYSDYKHLQFRMTVRTSRTDPTGDDVQLILNNDTTNSYARHFLLGGGSGVGSFGGSDDSILLTAMAGSNGETSGAFGAIVMDVLDFNNTSKNTTTRALGGRVAGGTDIVLASGLYNKTNLIQSASFSPTSGVNLVAGSRFSLYGIKG